MRRRSSGRAGCPGSTGKVATYGFSYPGLNQLLAAQRKPAGARRDRPRRSPAAGPYAGLVLPPGRVLARVRRLVGELPRARRRRAARGRRARSPRSAQGSATLMGLYWVLPLTAYPPLAGGDAPVLPRLARPPDPRRLLEPRSTSTSAGSTCPGLHVGGWWDVFVRGTVNDYVTLAARGTRAAEARARPMASHALAAARRRDRRRRRERRRRLAPALLARGARRRGDRRVRPPGHRVRDGRGLARPRRLAAVAAPARSTGSCTPTAGRCRSSATGTLSTEPPARRAARRLHLPARLRADRAPAATPAASRTSRRWARPIRTRSSGRSSSSSTRAQPLERDLELVGDVHGDALRGDERARHRLLGPALRRRPGRALDEPARGHRPRPLPRVADHPPPITPGEVYEYRIDLGPVGVRIPAGPPAPPRRSAAPTSRSGIAT